MIEIPLRSGDTNTHQRFSLRLEDNLLEFRINYLSYLEQPAWSMDILRDGTYLVAGAMLEPNAEVTRGYRAKIGRFFFIGENATLDNLGINNKLVWTAA